MKNKHAAAATAVALGLAFTLFAADPPAAAPETSKAQSPQTFKSEVLKVYTAKEDDALFRAYVVKWKGQEVIASDPLATTDYHVGETITVLAMNQPAPNGKAGPRLLHFLVVPAPAR